MIASEFVEKLNAQVANEFAAEQQYIAIAIYFDDETLPQLAAVFYQQALEERNHAMMMLQFLMDRGQKAIVPGVASPQTSFADIVEPIALALAQEERVAEQIAELTRVARANNDFISEEFTQWFLKEQVEEISKMNDLLKVAERSKDNPLLAEEFIARESFGKADGTEADAPVAAGGPL
ncbi:MAG: ferritin [Solirubrobacteraceae bacterium]|nr:ferritin [Solirubrobacteraceae bacterium]